MDDKDLIGSRVYSCFKCRNVVALHDDIVDKYFVAGKKGRAFLITRMMNIVEGTPTNRHLITGIHFVKDVFCSDCGEYLGWKYERVYSERHKYKEHKFAICKRNICKAVDAPSYLALHRDRSLKEKKAGNNANQGVTCPKPMQIKESRQKLGVSPSAQGTKRLQSIMLHLLDSFLQLRLERRAADEKRKCHSLMIYGP